MASLVENRSDVTIILMFFVILTIIGILAGGFFVRDFSHARASAAWPIVDGVVLSSNTTNSRGVRYAYSFEGHNYQGTRERVFSARFLKASPKLYDPGDSIAVYVDPVNPKYSVLYPGGAAGAFLFFSTFSGLLVFLGVGGIVWTFSEGVRTGNPTFGAS